MKYLVLTAKHHDGFCLWPTQTTEYSVQHSPRRIDVVGEVARACADAGLPFGLYLSPWDRNAACYPDAAAYDRFYNAQLTELCTRYGELFELWFDGAGSEGRTYDWDAIMETVAQHQPNAQVFNMGRPTIRWVGNENGVADDPAFMPSRKPMFPLLLRIRPLSLPHCNICRPNAMCRFASTGSGRTTTCRRSRPRNICWPSTTVPWARCEPVAESRPNRDGLLDEHDTARVLEVTQELSRRFAQPVRGTLHTQDNTVQVDFGSATNLDHLVLREECRHGQKIAGYKVYDDATGALVCEGKTVGYEKWHAFPAVTAQRLRIEFDELLAAGPQLTEATAHRTGHLLAARTRR
jgi:alpha-L-fucosidase